MNKNRKTVQLTLISIGLLLILITYFLYPAANETNIKKNLVEKENIVEKSDETDIVEKEGNIFENVEYKGLYDYNNPFSVKSKRAYILEEKLEVIYMTDMHVIINMRDGRIINITSDSGSYNKSTYDCFFEKNVKATDGKTIILSENLDLLASEDIATIYNNVQLNSENGSIQADKIEYDFEKKFYRISMFDATKVKVKLIK